MMHTAVMEVLMLTSLSRFGFKITFLGQFGKEIHRISSVRQIIVAWIVERMMMILRKWRMLGLAVTMKPQIIQTSNKDKITADPWLSAYSGGVKRSMSRIPCKMFTQSI